MKRLFLIIPIFLCTLLVPAQEQQEALRKLVVADMETRIPIRDVIAFTGAGYRDTTNYRGICHIPIEFDTLTVFKSNYLAEKITPSEVKDTVFLLPNYNRIGEVTVWGKDRAKELQENVEKWTNKAIKENPTTSTGFSIDFANMLDARRRRDMKHLNKTKKLFNKMDLLDEDPIINAYKKALKDERLKNEQAEKLEEQISKINKEENNKLKARTQETREAEKNLKAKE